MKGLIKVLTFGSLVLLMVACEDKLNSSLPITTNATITPSNGLTTTIFKFDLTKSINPNQGDARLFYRFDWESDGIWDNVFTDQSILEHRFYKPGHFKITVEGLDLHGQTDTSSLKVIIEQGFSKPRPQFKVLPSTGNILTTFVFDASQTKDDEDSLNTLKFRWDWDGDNIWDTPWLTSSINHHVFPVDGYYIVNLEVLDPSNLRNQLSTPVRVNLESDSIKPSFIIKPAYIIQKEEAIFDASGSIDLNNPGERLMYRWDWENDGTFDIEWTSDPIVRHTYLIEQEYTVKLEVKNSQGLRNSLTQKLEINHKNVAPTAFFKTSSIGGNILSSIRFDAWGSKDLESAPSDLFMRWDFNGDGLFDTEYAKDPVIFHQFKEAGEFNVVLEVKDNGDLTDTYSQLVYISPSNNQTDIMIDKRGAYWEYYGIVKVGNQWWFERNLSVQSRDKYQQVAYNNDESNSTLFGYLYPRGVLNSVCPSGWRVPSREDWDLLFSQFTTESLFESLKPGGRSDINLIYSGLGDIGPFPNVFSGLRNYGFFWSTTKPIAATSESSWYITIDKPRNQILKGFGGTGTEIMGIRCVKND